MHFKLIKIFLVLLFGLILAGCRSNFNDNSKKVTIDGREFHLEVAKTDQEREKGLMDRTTLAGDSGMLFLFGQKSIQNFWMKNTLIPLQIIFIDECRIVDIQEMAVEKDPLNPVNRYTSKLPVDKAIELYSGSVPNDLRQTIQELCN